MAGSGSDGFRATLIYPPGATARAIGETLTSDGVRTVQVGNVFKAVSSFTADPTDLVIIGLGELQDRDLEVIRVLREIRPEVFLLLLFPMDCRERAVKGLALGADAYLIDPFYMGELSSLVRRGLERSAAPPAPATEPPPPAEPADAPAGTEGSALETLAGAVAHAINNSLQIVELLIADSGDGGPDPQDLRKEAVRINDVVAELLAFARRGEHHPTRLDLNKLLQSQIPAKLRKSRRIRLTLAPDLPELDADERSLGFLVNSVLRLQTADNGKSSLDISTSRTVKEGGDLITLRFHAPGLVLSEEECRQFFVPFHGPAGGPVGLSTVTARSVIEAHDGTVDITSADSDGTVLTVDLPAAVPDAVSGEEKGALREGG